MVDLTPVQVHQRAQGPSTPLQFMPRSTFTRTSPANGGAPSASCPRARPGADPSKRPALKLAPRGIGHAAPASPSWIAALPCPTATTAVAQEPIARGRAWRIDTAGQPRVATQPPPLRDGNPSADLKSSAPSRGPCSTAEAPDAFPDAPLRTVPEAQGRSLTPQEPGPVAS